MLAVSVIVPVFNPGAHIDDCIASLLRQSLSPSEHELIFVDDGSTDGTAERLDALAAEHEQVRVTHISNSGWPGRPRNVGLDMACGEYAYFIDNDDWIDARALERMYATAREQDADIVIGKVVGHGKSVPRGLFARTQHGLTLESSPKLLGLLTPHKLFRRALVHEQGIRFPEGRRRLEDHVFVVHAYFHAKRISVLADHPCYHWVLRKGDSNASYRPFDPVVYFDNVREVLDLVEGHTAPGPYRDRLLTHWYRGKMLGRVGGRFFLRRDPEYRRELHREVRRLALERYGADVDDRLPFNLRVRSRLLREGSYEALEAVAALETALVATATVRRLRRRGNDLLLGFEATLTAQEGSLSFASRGDRVAWIAPGPAARELPDDALDPGDELVASRVQVFLRSLADASEFVLPSETEVRLARGSEPGDDLRPVLVVDARVSPATAAGGSPLPAGDWDVVAVVTVAGFSANARVRQVGGAERLRLVTTPRGRARKAPAAAQGSPVRKIARRARWLARRVAGRRP